MGYNPWSMTQLAIFQFSHLAACTLPDFFFGNKYLSQNHSQQERCFLLQVLNILVFYGGVLRQWKILLWLTHQVFILGPSFNRFWLFQEPSLHLLNPETHMICLFRRHIYPVV